MGVAVRRLVGSQRCLARRAGRLAGGVRRRARHGGDESEGEKGERRASDSRRAGYLLDVEHPCSLEEWVERADARG